MKQKFKILQTFIIIIITSCVNNLNESVNIVENTTTTLSYLIPTGSISINLSGINKESIFNISRNLIKTNIVNATVTIYGDNFYSPISKTISLSDGQGSCSITEIPVGKNRVITVMGLDSNGDEIQNVVIRNAVDIYEGNNNVNVNWNTTPRGTIYYYLLENDKSNGTNYSVNITGDIIETFIQDIIVDNNLVHPSLVDSKKISDYIITNNGNLPTSTIGYNIDTAKLSFSIIEKDNSDDIIISISDISSIDLTIDSNGSYILDNIYPTDNLIVKFKHQLSGSIAEYDLKDATADTTLTTLYEKGTFTGFNTIGMKYYSIFINPEQIQVSVSLDDLIAGSSGDKLWYKESDFVRSGVITDSQESVITKTINADSISFYWSVSSEDPYDELYFYLDDILLSSICGEVAWGQKTFNFAYGAHTVKWSYAKDYMMSNGSDCGYLKDVFSKTTISQARKPLFSLPEGSYANQATTTLISEISGATIKYTLDGSNPSPDNGEIYISDLTFTSTTTVKAIIYKFGLKVSDIESVTYTITN